MKKIYEKCLSLRNLCFGKFDNRFNHDDIGWNYRFTNLQAAFGLGQMKNLNWIVKRKQEIGKRYYNKLKKNKNIILQDLKKPYAKNIYWVFGILIKKNINLAKKVLLKNYLRKIYKLEIFSFQCINKKFF